MTPIPAATNGRNRRVFLNGTGFYLEFTEGGSTYGGALGEAWETGSSVKVTESLMNAAIAAAKRAAPQPFPDGESVDAEAAS